jgi:serine/threonine protein kinase
MNPMADSLSGACEDAVLAELVESLTARLQAGQPIDLDRIARDHPAQAEPLRQLLPALEALAGVAVKDRGPVSDSGAPDLDMSLRGVLGDFRIVREIGRGGMGVVYEAVQLSLDRRVALKVLPFAATLNPRQRQRFQTEARAAAQLHHSNIVPVYAVGSQEGVDYYAMQYIEGQTLAAHIQDRRTRDHSGCASFLDNHPASFFQTVAELGIQTAEALDYAHQVGVVHRDIKPANLLLDVAGNLWITDFGLVRWHREMGLTGSGEWLGTLRYMSPEQALGEREVVDHRTDVYALGVTLYELLTQETPWTGQTREQLLRQIGEEEPRPPRCLDPTIPVDLETILLKAMARQAVDRYGTAQELADDLRCFLENKTIRARRPSLWEQTYRWVSRHQRALALLTGLLLLATVGFATSTALVVRERNEAERRQRQARQAVDRMYTDVAQKWLSQQPYLEPL